MAFQNFSMMMVRLAHWRRCKGKRKVNKKLTCSVIQKCQNIVYQAK